MRDRDDDLRDEGLNNELKGKADKMKGRVKDAAGGLTDDTSLQAEGKWDKVKGSAKEALGDAQQELGRKHEKFDRKREDDF